MCIGVTEVSKPYNLARVLVVHQILLDIHFIHDQRYTFLPLLELVHIGSSDKLNIDFFGKPACRANKVGVVPQNPLRRESNASSRVVSHRFYSIDASNTSTILSLRSAIPSNGNSCVMQLSSVARKKSSGTNHWVMMLSLPHFQP